MADLKYPEEIYFDPSHADSFSGPEKNYMKLLEKRACLRSAGKI